MQIKNHFQSTTRQQAKQEEKMIRNIQSKLANRTSLTYSEVLFFMDWEISVERLKHNARLTEAVLNTSGVGKKTGEAIRESISSMMNELPSYSTGIIEENRAKAEGEKQNEEG